MCDGAEGLTTFEREDKVQTYVKKSAVPAGGLVVLWCAQIASKSAAQYSRLQRSVLARALLPGPIIA